jgi:hypothetical protein
MAMGKGCQHQRQNFVGIEHELTIFKSAPVAPFMTVGIALHMAATKTIHIASLGERPKATTAAQFAHVEYVTRSANQ